MSDTAASASPSRPWGFVPRADRSAPLELPEPVYDRYSDPAGYDPGEDLVAAVNVALLLGQPLLVTGDPGSGKTSLGYWLARQLGLEAPLVHVVKSTTTGRDLLYSFDELARFRDAQSQVSRPEQDYLELNALGLAIVFSAGPEARLSAGAALRDGDRAPTIAASAPLEGFAAAPLSGLPQAAPGADHPPRPERHRDLYQGPFPADRRQVVLIDEFDKAPRDTPNDLLAEMERMAFRIPEIGLNIRGDRHNRPVVVITSNSEKSLPEPFLRRCVYHHIPTPDRARREEIVRRRNAAFARSERGPQFSEAMDLFEDLRTRLSRSPGAAELLAWLDALDRLIPLPQSGAPSSIRTYPERLKTSLSVLAKTREDLEMAKSAVASA
jgi:MoxR-like ATPase